MRAALDPPIEIDTCAELQDIELDLTASYILTDDIDCSSFDAGDSGGFRDENGGRGVEISPRCIG